MRFWTVEQVIANAMTVIKEADDMDRVLFRQWVYSGLREIGPSIDNEKVVRINKDDSFLRKPDDLLYANDIALFDVSGNELRYKYRGSNRRIHSNAESDSSFRPIDLGEDDNYFILGSNGGNVEYADLRYYGMPLDYDGNIKIPEHTVEPIKMYIRYQWSLRQNDNRSAIDQNKSYWEMERRKARGRNKMPSMLQGTAIAETWMSMINKNESKQY